jgi:hypothetical protein
MLCYLYFVIIYNVIETYVLSSHIWNIVVSDVWKFALCNIIF